MTPLLLSLTSLAQDVDVPAINAQLFRPSIDSTGLLWTDDTSLGEGKAQGPESEKRRGPRKAHSDQLMATTLICLSVCLSVLDSVPDSNIQKQRPARMPAQRTETCAPPYRKGGSGCRPLKFV